MNASYVEFQARVDLLRQFLDHAKTNTPLRLQPVLKDSFVVLLHGHWENFLRELMAEYLGKVTKLGLPYAELPLSIQNTNKRITIDLMVKGMDWFDNVTHEYIADRYNRSLNLNDSSGIIIESFCLTYSSADKGVVVRLFEQIGVAKIWQLVNEEVNGERIRTRVSRYNEPAAVKSKLIKSQLDTELNNMLDSLLRFVEARNEIAHHGKMKALSIEFSQAEDFISLITSFAKACSVVAERHFEEVYGFEYVDILA